jgi:hypothetical protein
VSAPLAIPNPPLPSRDQLIALVDKARVGDDKAMTQVRRVMDDPVGRRMFADLASRIRAGLTASFARDDPVLKELLDREVKRLRTDLLGPEPTAVERLLAERVAIGWLQVHIAEYQLTDFRLNNAHFWQDQVDRAQRRFLAALRLLAAVRKLPRPAMQVNIGDQQVNVSG